MMSSDENTSNRPFGIRAASEEHLQKCYSRAVVTSTFVESKTRTIESKWDGQNRERKKYIFIKTTYLIVDNLCDTRDSISSILR